MRKFDLPRISTALPSLLPQPTADSMDKSSEVTYDVLDSHVLKETDDMTPTIQGLPRDLHTNDKSHPKVVVHHAATPQSSSILGSGSSNSESPVGRAANQLVVSKIEEYIRLIADGLQRKVEISIPLRVRKQTAGSAPAGKEEGMLETLVKFPGRNAQEAWRFGRPSYLDVVLTADSNTAVLVRILDLLHEALTNNVVVSKRCISSYLWVITLALVSLMLRLMKSRNMYYKDPLLFKKQAVVDRYVDILAYTFGVQRADLNVVGGLSFR